MNEFIKSTIVALERMFDDKIWEYLNPNNVMTNLKSSQYYTNPYVYICIIEDFFGENYQFPKYNDTLFIIPKSLIKKIVISNNYEDMMCAVYGNYHDDSHKYPFIINIAFTFLISLCIGYNNSINMKDGNKFIMRDTYFRKLRINHLQTVLKIINDKIIDDTMNYQAELIDIVDSTITNYLFTCMYEYMWGPWDDGYYSCRNYFDNELLNYTL